MEYFDGIQFSDYRALPKCTAQIDGHFNFYAINFIRSGTFKFQYKSNTFTPQPPFFLITTPNKNYRYGPGDSGNWDHLYITFTGPRIDKWKAHGLFPSLEKEAFSIIPISEGHPALLAFDQLYKSLTQTSKPAESIHLLERVFLQFHLYPDKSLPSSILTRQITAIQAQPEAPWSVESLAKSANISIATYRRHFNTYTGISPMNFVVKQRIKKAEFFLRYTHTPIKEIALICGYKDVFHFSKTFAKYKKVSPARYRINIDK